MPKTSIEADGLGDWRLRAVTRIVKSVPPAYPGGPAHQAGSSVILSTLIEWPPYGTVSFPTPSATALTLSAAFSAAKRAVDLRSKLHFTRNVGPGGKMYTISSNTTDLLFEYLEFAMASIGSSFQAVEAFANEKIAANISGKVSVQLRKEAQLLSAEEIERQLSTEEKLGVILPRNAGLAEIKGTLEWELFRKLKKARDSLTHFKSADQYPQGSSGKALKDSLYDILINTPSLEFPVNATRILRKILSNSDMPRWLQHLAEVNGIR
jgi:hypothetical protein